VAFVFADSSTRLVQVNCCRYPQCANYGVPATFARRAKADPATKGTEYRLSSSGKGLPQLHCLLCGEWLPIKSHQGIVEELAWITAYTKASTPPSCPDPACTNP
jgi:hypothetical protein